ncbi:MULTISPECIES: SlyX family protein [Lentibacter]|jgi:SlyX protein|uniref:SlyX protein n=1 Tax=Lentibacter algarum TaxID=576131 RepID=A0A1H3H4Q5_9RHOB|nr:SlyX family protein [Lentibacter algarum]MCH9823918.1 SlyX family protein [Alphaproteobacteria bacterium]MCO4777480.1 SlyX family protein [Lentibacter algarum]MCO4826909.1 SlyX family protein [Lentibacter algarum]WIF30647.1 protein slyX-like protein [Lentibacter algarum]SDY09629.1 SlyX protein [Lentibacter algarum]
MESLEEKIAHLERTTDELSSVIARQDTEIALLTRQVQILLDAEASRNRSEGAHIFGGDERPPHY